MFSWPGRIAVVILTAFAVYAEISAFHDSRSTAAIGVGFGAIFYVLAMVALLIADFVITALVRSRRAVRDAERDAG